MKSLRTGLILLLLAAPGVASADYYWQYETDEGVLSYTDDARRIPEKYKSEAERHEARPLFDYDRATLVKKGASTASAESIFGAELLGEAPRVRRDIDWSMASRPLEHFASSGTRMDLRIDDAVSLGIDFGDDADTEPIHIDRGVYRNQDGEAYDANSDDVRRSSTVVRKGGRELVVIQER